MNRSSNSRIDSRQSNFELLRIILMLLVIAHHYVVNSGVMDCFDYSNPTANMFYLQCFGAFGKVAINCFVLITGYFMFKSKWSWKKWLKLYLEIKFYTVAFYIIFVLSGYQPFNYHECLETIFSMIFGVGKSYADTYLVLYLLIPFLNLLVEHMTAHQHRLLLGFLFAVFSMIPTFSLFMSVLHSGNDTWNYLSWMVFLYFLGVYLGKYKEDFRVSMRLRLVFLSINLLAIFGWLGIYDLWAVQHDIASGYWFVNDANKLLALSCAVALFMVFEKISIPRSRFINTVAGTTFGVFMIHSCSDAMRTLLWSDIFACSAHYHSPVLILHSLLAVSTVFIVCGVLDLARQWLLEKPLFRLIDRRFGSTKETYHVSE